MQSSEAQRRSPYQGLIPYGEMDAPFFFGREREARLITANLFASTLTLLYGASGVGKSSVLRAGVAHQLRQREDLLVVVFNAWQGDAATSLKTKVAEAVARIDRAVAPPADDESLVDYLSRCADETGRRLMIILDQFEEYFLYHPQNDSFAEEFPRAITQTDAPISFLISIREDFYAKLDRFEDRIPALYANYLRIEHLDMRAARSAIEKPVEQYNRLYANGHPISLEPRLVEAVLKQVETGQVLLGEAGRGVVEATKGEEASEAEIETPYLQLVMTRLWDEEMSAGSETLRLETLEKLGGAESIVRTHLDHVMNTLEPSEQKIAAHIFHYLVTPSGTKIAYIASDLASLSNISEQEIVRVLERLSQSGVRILRPIDPLPDRPTEPRYEIFHDVLAAAILNWRTKFVQAEERAEAERKLALEAEERAKAERQLTRERGLRRGLVIVGVVLFLMLIAMGGLTVWAFEQRTSAEKARADALQQRNEAVQARADAERARDDANSQRKEAVAQGEKADKAAKDALDQRNAAQAASTEAEHQRKNAEESATAAKAAQREAENNLTRYMEARKDTERHRQLEAAKEALNTNPVGSMATARGVIESLQGSDKEDSELKTDAVDVLRRSLLAQLGANFKTELHGHTESVQAAAFSPDGKLIATGSDDNGVRLWNATDGKFIGALAEPDMKAPIESVTFNRDGTLLLIKAVGDYSADNNIHVHDARTGMRVQSFKGVDAKFSTNGREVIVADKDETVRVWSKELPEIEVHRPARSVVERSAVQGTWLSSDGEFALEISNTRRVQVWQVKTGQGVLFPTGDEDTTGAIDSAAFSPDNNLVALGSHGQVEMWNVGSPAAYIAPPKLELEGHKGVISSIAFSPDNNLLATVDAEGTTRVWRAEDGANVATLWDETEEVTSATFSPDSKYVITLSSDGSARVWNAERGQLYAVLRGHTGPLNSVAFNSKGDALLTASFDGTARLWDWQPETWRTKPLVLDANGSPLRKASFLPDNKSVLTIDYQRARIWDAKSGQRISETPVVNGYPQEFSSDGSLLAVADKEDFVTVKDVQTGRTWSDKSTHIDEVKSIAFSRDSRFAVTASADNTAIVWNTETGKTVAKLGLNVRDMPGDGPPYRNPVLGAAFSPDGKQVVTWSEDKIVRVWDWQTGSKGTSRLTLSGHTARLSSAAFSPDGKLIVTTSFDQTARVWNATTGKLIAILPRQKTPIQSAVFSPDSKLVVTVESYGARVWELPTTDVEGQTLTPKFELTGQQRPAASAEFSLDGKLLLTGGGRSAQLWDMQTGQSLAELKGHQVRVTSAKFSPDGKLILTASIDKTARVWDVPADLSKEKVLHERVTLTARSQLKNATWSSDGKSIFTFGMNKSVQKWDWQTESGRSQPVNVLDGDITSVSPDGRYVGSVSHEDITRVYEARTGRKLVDLRGYHAEVGHIIFSPDNRFVAEFLGEAPLDDFGDGYFHVLVWEVATGRTVGGVNLALSDADCMAFSEDGKWFAVGSSGEVLLFDTGTGAVKEPLAAHNGTVNSVAFSPDGKYVVSAGDDKIARVWETATGKLFKELRGHFRSVQSAVFSRDGRLVVTASKDKSARIWNMGSADIIVRDSLLLKGHTGTVNSAEFSLDGRFVVTASEDSTARLWNATNGKLLAELVGHKDSVRTAKFSPDGGSIITSSNDTAARIFTCRECGSTKELLEEANALASKPIIQEQKKP